MSKEWREEGIGYGQRGMREREGGRKGKKER